VGIPIDLEYMVSVCRLSGRDGIPQWDFYMAFSMFRLASIVQGVYKRGLDGNAASTTATQYGQRARELAELAWSLVKHRAG
jgi:aminoglycoside phosphotransferase (APT) family kinase protein